MRYCRLLIILSLLGFFHAALAWSNPKPPPVSGVLQMFDAFNQLEGQFRKDQWEESRQTILYIQTYYSRLAQELKASIDNRTVHRFGFLINRLKTKVENGEQEAAQETYMQLQSHFLEIMEQYEYPAPPAIMIYSRYLEEAINGLEKGDFHEAAEEMAEILALRAHGRKALEQKAVAAAEISTFFATVERAEQAAREENLLEAKESLQQLRALINNYLPNS